MSTVDADGRPSAAETRADGTVATSVASGTSTAGTDRTSKAGLNATSAALEYGVRIAISFVINPLLVRRLGSVEFGTYQVVNRLVGYLSPASGRPTQALKWTLSHHNLTATDQDKRRQVGAAMAVWLVAIPIVSLGGAALAYGAPGWIHAPGDLRGAVRLSIALLVFNLLLTVLAEIPHSVLQGENLGYKRMGVSALIYVAGGAVTYASILAGMGMVSVAVAELAMTVTSASLYLKVVRTHVSWFGVARPARGALAGFAGLSGWFLVWNLVTQLMRASDVVLLGILGSASLVTSYTLTKYVPETVISLVEMVVLGVAPGLGGLIGLGEKDRAGRIRAEMMALSWLLLAAMGATILIWNGAFLRLWVGQQHFAGSGAALGITASVMQFVLIRNDAHVIDLTLRMRAKVLLGLGSAALAITLGAIALGPLDAGIGGLLVALMLGRSVLSIGYPWLVGRYLGTSLAGQLRAAVRPLLVTVALFALSVWLAPKVGSVSWFALVPATGMTFLVSLAVCAVAGLNGAQRDRIGRRLGVLRTAVADRRSRS